jgi:hypothetical protein
VSPIANRVTAINDHPRPTTVKELQGFLGVINFYRRFIPAAAHILKPLTDQLKGGPKPAASIPWTEARQAILFGGVVYPVSETQHPAYRDNHVPSAEQRDG